MNPLEEELIICKHNYLQTGVSPLISPHWCWRACQCSPRCDFWDPPPLLCPGWEEKTHSWHPHPHPIFPLQPISKWGLVCHHPQPDTLQILINRCPKLLLANQIFTFSRGFTPDTFSKVRHTKLSLTLREKGSTDRAKIGEMCVREMCFFYWCVNIVQRSWSHKFSSIAFLVITLKWYKSVNWSL